MGDVDEEAAEVWVASIKRQQRYGCCRRKGGEGVGGIDEEAVKAWVASTKRW